MRLVACVLALGGALVGVNTAAACLCGQPSFDKALAEWKPDDGTLIVEGRIRDARRRRVGPLVGPLKDPHVLVAMLDIQKVFKGVSAASSVELYFDDVTSCMGMGPEVAKYSNLQVRMSISRHELLPDGMYYGGSICQYYEVLSRDGGN